MRTITYKCDRCGKQLLSRNAVKLNINMQKGSEQAEKKPFDFCSACFLHMKKAFFDSLDPEQDDIVLPQDIETLKPDKAAAEAPDEAPRDVEMPMPAAVPETEAVPDPVVSDMPAAVPETEAVPAPKDGADVPEGPHPGLTLGPLSPEERAEILRLYVEEELCPDVIAARMNRLPRGIKRTINTAAKNGDLAKLKARYLDTQASEQVSAKTDDAQDEDETAESWTGSGASNAGIMKDTYTAPPRTETILGKRYDVGCVLALSKAGWPPSEIANEKHYDVDVIRVIIEKYM